MQLKKTNYRDIFYLAILACGINLCFTFQLANLSSIFKFLGASTTELPLLWLIPPLTGLIIQPLIGQMSDDTITRFGKRRPYIIVWSILAGLAFAYMPFAGSLLSFLILILVIDSSLNGSIESIRTLTGDLITTQADRSKAFAVQAFFSGIGGVVGVSLPLLINKGMNAIDWQTPLLFGQIPLNLKLSFGVISLILATITYIAIAKIKEKKYSKAQLLARKRKKLSLLKRMRKTFYDLYLSFKKMPLRFRRVCWIHATTWMGIFIFWLYFTVAYAQNIYGLPVHAHIAGNAHFTEILQKSSLDAAYYFSIYQYVSVLYSVLLYLLSRYARLRLVHAVSLFLGGLGLVMVSMVQSNVGIIIAFVLIGIMWGSMLVLPYSIAMQLLPKGKLGAYLGIFNICITLPQILCGIFLGPIYNYLFQGHAGYLLMFAGCLIITSAFLWWREENKNKPVFKENVGDLAFEGN